jgi:hypothetical protein
MDGVAAEWYYALERDHGILPWTRFMEFMNTRFGPPLRTNGLAELKALYRTSTVEDYQWQFSMLLCRCEDLTFKQQVNFFTAGLREPLRIDVELMNPADLQTAMSLARAYERCAAGMATGGQTRGTSRALSTVTKTNPAPQQQQTAMNRPWFKRRTTEELAAKQACGECYHCPEKYTADHKCASKGVFLLELDDNMEEEEAVSDLGISLHALTGIDDGTTMKLHVSINGTTLVPLLDSGSTHTFVQEEVAARIDLRVEPCPGLSVKVANGDQITSSGVCPKQRLSIDSEDFDVNCFILPLAGFNIVLRVQWLRSLGPILWNYKEISMAFWHHGRSVQLTGVGGIGPRCSSLSTPRISWKHSSAPLLIFSSSHGDYHHLVSMIIASNFYRDQLRWRSVHTVTRNCSKMRLRSNVMTCCSKVSFVSLCRHSPLLSSW